MAEGADGGGEAAPKAALHLGVDLHAVALARRPGVAAADAAEEAPVLLCAARDFAEEKLRAALCQIDGTLVWVGVGGVGAKRGAACQNARRCLWKEEGAARGAGMDRGEWDEALCEQRQRRGHKKSACVIIILGAVSER